MLKSFGSRYSEPPSPVRRPYDTPTGRPSSDVGSAMVFSNRGVDWSSGRSGTCSRKPFDPLLPLPAVTSTTSTPLLRPCGHSVTMEPSDQERTAASLPPMCTLPAP